MNAASEIAPAETDRKIAALVETLRESEQQLAALAQGDAAPAGSAEPDDGAFRLRDVEERLRAGETALLEFAETQTAILDALPAGVALLDAEGRIVAANQGWKRFFAEAGVAEPPADGGTEYLEFCARTLGPAFAAEGGIAAGLRRVLSGAAREFSTEFSRPAPSGTLWFTLLVAPVHPTQPTGAVVTHLDVTEKKKLEAQNIRAQRMESVGTLANGIAHGLNNVLAPILLSLELLRLKFPENDAQNLLATLEASAKRGADLVRQVLSIARGIEGQRIALNPVHLLLDLQKIAWDTFPKNIVINLDTRKNLWAVMGDPAQLHQVFLNLCVNARDAMPNGGTLSLSTENLVLDADSAARHPEAKPGPYVLVRVTDTGAGISPEVQERIFEPFFTTKGGHDGTGLGLSTTLAIVKSHGGFIDLDSAVGRGSQFRIYLPANPAEIATDPAAESLDPLPRGNQQWVLVVDDEEPIRQTLRLMLESFGYRVLLAADGAEALALYREHSEDITVVLTDMAMPVMDGPATILALKALAPNLPIIASSGLVTERAADAAIAANVKCFVPKPYTADVLLQALQQALGGGLGDVLTRSHRDHRT